MFLLVLINHVTLLHFLYRNYFVRLFVPANSYFAESATADNLQGLIVVYCDLRSSNMNVNRRIEFELTIVYIFLLPYAEFPT